jgi:arylsulfatase A-like enzyme
MCAVLAAGVPSSAADRKPSVLLITVDALRADRLSAYGYTRPTSPAIDDLLAHGLRFEQARTVEPLTGPAMCSMITGISPHKHGATRNGLRMQQGLESLPDILARNGWNTAGFIGTWTLKNNLTLLGTHFEHYGEVLNRKRWFGLLNSEATCDDLTDDALEWARLTRSEEPNTPLFLWVHYIEPHAPYRYHDEYAGRLGISGRGHTDSDSYDTEIAAVDESISELVGGVRKLIPAESLIIVFTADHGESLGEHSYWGHGRYLYEPSLHIPLGMTWEGEIVPATTAVQATLLDIAPTLLDLMGLGVPNDFEGISWAQAARGGIQPEERTLCFQAHKGAVHGGSHDSDKARSGGLLEVGVVSGQTKETYRMRGANLSLYDLEADPGELVNLSPSGASPSKELAACLARVSSGLGSLDHLAARKLDDETVEQLRALGYLE